MKLVFSFFDSFIIFLVWQMCLLRPHSSIVLYVHVLDTFHICSFACCSGKDISDYTVYVWQLWQHISGENTCIIRLIQSYVLAVVLHLFVLCWEITHVFSFVSVFPNFITECLKDNICLHLSSALELRLSQGTPFLLMLYTFVVCVLGMLNLFIS